MIIILLCSLVLILPLLIIGMISIPTNCKTEASKVEINRAESSKEDDDILGGAEFPYRRKELEKSVKHKLKILLNVKPSIVYKDWKIPFGKVNKKLTENIFKEINVIVRPSINNHWEYDQIIDYYNERARVKTPGYGEKYSPYEFWKNKDLHERWLGKDPNPREAIYKSITEARPAYSSVAVSLYKYFIDILPPKIISEIKVLDIAAYGERAIASANLGIHYTGIDPNTDLIKGHSELIKDILSIKPESKIEFEYIGLEDYLCDDKSFDIITYSPPPFNTEPYHGNKEMQCYTKYPTFQEYFCCFLTELIYKASRAIDDDCIFAFTALDRDPDKFRIKIPDKYRSENTKLIYVEALLLVTLCYGFSFHGAVGLSVGDKDPQVPWWTFKYTKTLNSKSLLLLKNTWPMHWQYIGPRLISNQISLGKNLCKEYDFRSVISTDNYDISFVKLISKKSYEQKIFIEILRHGIQNYICDTLSKLLNMPLQKVKTIMGRYLMLRSITATFEEPWLSCMFVDPVFPTSSDMTSLIEDQIIKNINKENATYVIQQKEYIFGSYKCIGITHLYDTIANYLQTITLSKVGIKIEGHIVKGNDYVLSILSKYMYLKGNTIWSLKPDVDDLLTFIRYETLSARGHQFTRSSERTKILNKIVDDNLIDIYASVYNNQSKEYCSIYPDVEKDAIGSAFCLKMKQGSYLANPVDIPIFLTYALKPILRDLDDAYENNRHLTVCMAFTLWTDVNPNFIHRFSKDWRNEFINCDNIGLQTLADNKHIKAVYILDKSKFPSTLQKSTSNRENTISVGVIMSTKDLPGITEKNMIPLCKDISSFIIL